MRFVAGLAILYFLLAVECSAQEIGANKPVTNDKPYTLSVKAQLVIEPVSVKDRQGRPITGLVAKDFFVTEDGAEQNIRFCEYEDISPASAVGPQAVPEEVRVYRQLAHTQISAEGPESSRHKNRRLMALYFDMTAMPPSDQIRALGAAEKFIRTQMTAADQVAILRFSGGSVDVLQDFTYDHNRLLSILETLIVGEGQGQETIPADASSADTGAAFGQDSSEFNIFNTDRQLSALQTAARMLGGLNEKKSLVYFASGLRLNGINNQAQLHATIDAAIRAGVSFWPIDARGLVAQAPLGDASRGSPGNVGMYSGAAASAVSGNLQQSQDALFALASDTGGKASFDSNDLVRGILQAQASVTSYYILGYYTSNTAQNGRFRRIKVSLAGNAGATLDFRQGYYAGKEFGMFTAVDKERQLEDALMLNDPITDLTIAMEIDYFQLNRAEYFVPIIVKIPGRELALARKFGAEHTLIDFVGEIKDSADGNTVTNIHDKVDIKLTGSTAAELARRPIEYDAGFTLLPGRYTIKFLARDDETGRIGTFQTMFVVPNLNKDDGRIPVSSVILSSQIMRPQDALYNTGSQKDRLKEGAVDPLVQNGGKLIPSVTRVFSQSRTLYVYLQAYEQRAEGPEPLLGFVTLYQGANKVFETKSVEASKAAAGRLETLPFSFSIGLGNIRPGEYTCQVSVLDPTSGKGTFWRAPILIVP